MRYSVPILTVLSAVVLMMSCAKRGPELAMSNEQVRLAQITTAGAVDVDWSPDGEWLTFASNSDIWIKPVAGGETTQVTKDPARDDTPRWSPDGKKLLFYSHRSGALNIWTISPFADGESLFQVTDDADSVGSGTINWSPDGKEIAFSSVLGGTRQIWAVPAAGGTARQVTTGTDGKWDPDFSPDGAWIIYSTADNAQGGDPNLWMVPAAGGTARPFTTESVGDFVPRWSPDGQWVSFSSLRGAAWDIWIKAATGGEPFKIPNPGFRNMRSSWSPDSRRIAFQAGSILGDLWVVPTAGGEPRRVVDQVYNRYGTQTSWSGDGSEIAFFYLGPGGKDIWKQPVSGGPRVAVTRGGAVLETWRSGLSWSPDGNTLAFNSNTGGDSNLWTVPAKGGPPTQITFTSKPRIAAPSWSPDSQRIAYGMETDGNQDIWTVQASGGTPEHITDWPGSEQSPSWSPDGKRLVFTSDKTQSGDTGGANLWVFVLDTGHATWLARGFQPDWSPDGKQICFVQDNDIWIVPALGGSPVLLLDSPQKKERWPQWSPDGSHILFSHAVGGYDIWIADVGRLLDMK
jgi:Tol biopolymer transport system component